MNIVCFGQQNWAVTWSAKQHLLTRLARRGHRVLYVDPIFDTGHRSIAARFRALAPTISSLGLRDEAGVHVFTPPWAHLLPDRLNRRRRFGMVRRIARKLGLSDPVALCTWPQQRWLMDAVRPAARVYLAFDDNAGFSGLDETFILMQREEEARLLAECDVALAVSETLRERFAHTQPRTYLQENGVNLADFSPEALEQAAPHPAIAPLPRPRVGFVGQIDERMDQALVVALARQLATRQPAGSVVLAGRVKEGVDISALKAEPNVHVVGFVPYDRLAGVYRELDVGLVPYVISPLTQACNPLKVYEYLAADLPVVATNLAGLNSTRDAIEVAGDAETFFAAVERALTDPSASRDARRRVAEASSWDRRAEQLEARLQEALSQRQSALQRRAVSP